MAATTRRLVLAPLCGLAAPLVWLERSRGRRRTALAVLYGLLVVLGGVVLWRESRLAGLPEIGDPFDTRPLRSLRVRDDVNAFVLYREACDRRREDRAIERRILGRPYAALKGDAEALAHLDAAAEALEVWRRGCERADALDVPIDDIRIDTKTDVAQLHRRFARLALVEASRRHDAGDLEGAWTWYRAVLRGSRLVGRHGGVVGRFVGLAELSLAQAPIGAWMADPRVDARLLRRALADAVGLDALATPASEPLRVGYVVVMKALEDPQRLIAVLLQDAEPWPVAWVDRTSWWHHSPAFWRVRQLLDHEPERSRRLVRLVHANWLAYCDRPPERRPRIIGAKVMPGGLLFDAPGPGGMPAEELLRLVDSAPLAKELLLSLGNYLAVHDRDRARRAKLVVDLAERIWTLERGRLPATPDALVGTYLDRLPDGYVRPDEEPATTKGTER